MAAGEKILTSGTNIGSASGVALKHWMPLAVFAASILTTCLFLAVLPDRFRGNDSSDYTAHYEPVARSILGGRGFVLANGEFASLYPPGYSLLLAGAFGLSQRTGLPEQVVVTAISVVAMALVTVFIFVLARMFWGKRPAIVAAGLWLTYPFGLWLTKQPNSELPFMVVFYGAIVLLADAMRRRSGWPLYFMCGFLFGLAMLVRPIAIGIPLVACAIVYVAARRFGIPRPTLVIVALVAGTVMAVLPWEVLAYSNTGRVIPLATSGSRGMRDGLTYGVITKDYRTDREVSGDVALLMQQIFDHTDPDKSVGHIVWAAANQAAAHPVAMGKLIALKIARSWYGTDSERGESGILFVQLIYLIAIGWSTRRLWQVGGNDRLIAISVLLVTLYFWGMTVLVLSIFRYMLPVMPLMLVVVGAAFAQHMFWKRRSARRIPVAS